MDGIMGGMLPKALPGEAHLVTTASPTKNLPKRDFP
jgi:hypothetical protein